MGRLIFPALFTVSLSDTLRRTISCVQDRGAPRARARPANASGRPVDTFVPKPITTAAPRVCLIALDFGFTARIAGLTKFGRDRGAKLGSSSGTAASAGFWLGHEL